MIRIETKTKATIEKNQKTEMRVEEIVEWIMQEGIRLQKKYASIPEGGSLFLDDRCISI